MLVTRNKYTIQLQEDKKVHIYADVINKNNVTGSDAIFNSLNSVNKNICVCVGCVQTSSGFPSLVIAYNKEIFGDVTNKSIQELNLQMTMNGNLVNDKKGKYNHKQVVLYLL